MNNATTNIIEISGQDESNQFDLQNPQESMASRNQLSENEKAVVFERIKVQRSLVIHEYGGVGWSSQNPIEWDYDSIILAPPSLKDKTVINQSFFSITQDLATIGVDTNTIPFTKPWLIDETEFTLKNRNNGDDEPDKEYLMGKHVSNKITLNIDPLLMKPSRRFMDILMEAIVNCQDNIHGYEALIKILNYFGYYVPTRLTLGGVLFQYQETEFGDEGLKKQSFTDNFEAALESIRQGANYDSASSEFDSFRQMGGTKDTSHNYSEWMNGLASPSSWVVTSYDSFIPTLALIGMQNMAVGNACYNLLRKFSTYAEVQKLQEVIDMRRYANEAKQYYMNPI